MRISDWSSDVCSSDLPAARFERLVCAVQPCDRRELGQSDGRAHDIRGDEWRAAPRGAADPFPYRRYVRSARRGVRSEEHTPELHSLMRNSYSVFCLKKNNT